MEFGISEIIASASAVGACSAVFVAWNQARLTHKHNQLSVRPFLTSNTESDFESGYFKLTIRNSGFGPARIINFIAYRDGKVASPNDPRNSYYNALLGLKLESERIGLTQIKKGHIIAANQEDTILEFISEKRGTPQAFKEVENELNRVGFMIEYEDFYGNRMEALTTFVEN